jgi:hypothetical protein
MMTVILAVLMLLAVFSIVSGAPAERGKLRYGDETCLPVILQRLQLHTIASLLNYELSHGVWRNTSKNPGKLVLALEAKMKLA